MNEKRDSMSRQSMISFLERGLQENPEMKIIVIDPKGELFSEYKNLSSGLPSGLIIDPLEMKEE